MKNSENIIETERLRLVPFSEAFLGERYVGWLNDSETTAYSEQRHRTHTLDSCRSYMESFAGTSNLFLAIVRKEDDLHIGNINAYVDVHNQTADVGILIGDRTVWGQGFGLEAWAALCDDLLESGLRKITAGTMACNAGMIRIFEKYGMVFEGRREKQFLCDGQDVDMVMYRKFDDSK